MHVAEGVHRPDLRRARVRSPRDRRARPRRPGAGRVRVGRRHRRAAGRDHVRPGLRTDSTSATFEFSANASNPAYECSLDAGEWTPCTSPKTYNGLLMAPHTFEVRVLVPEGRRSRRSRSTRGRSPSSTRPRRPSSSGHPAVPSISTTRDVRDRERRGRLDLRVLARQRRVRALPGSGRLHRPGRRPAHVQGARDRRGRQRGPDAGELDVDGRGRPDGAGDDAPGPPGCRDDAGRRGLHLRLQRARLDLRVLARHEPFASCESPVAYTDLALGEHTFRIRATDAHGNVEAPQSYTWNVILDTVPPETTLRAGRPTRRSRPPRRSASWQASSTQRSSAHSTRAVRRVRLADGVHGPRGRPAHVRGARGRPRRQRGSVARELRLDGRGDAGHGGARGEDPDEPGRSEPVHDRGVHVRLRGRRDVRVLARR